MLSVIGQTRSIQEAVVHKRERFVMSVRCPVCALNGPATWKENEKESLDMTITSLSHGFRTSTDDEIRCANCGVNARVIGIASGTRPGHSATSGRHL
jgi:Zn ribbon nucleic-acid-binding protein